MPAIGRGDHRFDKSRPEPGALTVRTRHAPHERQPFRPLPAPTGPEPHHLRLADILTADALDAIQQSGHLVFHTMGDCGGVKQPEPQQLVAMKLEEDFHATPGTPDAAFLYLLGDVVYFYGESGSYYDQFYDPYKHYPRPIFAIPGNHDGDVNPHAPAPSLEAFVNNFCAPQPVLRPEAGDAQRTAMTQPNVYWTLEAPFATIIGLYTNVPEGGQLDDQQLAWLQQELAAAPADHALLVTMHHPIYSADTYHSGSQYMAEVLDTAAAHARRTPDLVLAGHVHNYQRFTRTTATGKVPYIVAGAGGYWHLHAMQKLAGGPIPTPYQLPDPDSEVTLESYVDDDHGFLRVDVTAETITGQYLTVPRP